LPHENLDLPKLLAVRQRKIGALLRQERMNASISIRNLAHETGISGARIKAYELGERPMPLPELEALVKSLGGRVESFFDRTGPIGQWLMNEEAIRDFLELPLELRQFVAMPVNRPYLELAMKLSNMSRDKLRSVAEDILDITF
jgi:transcriptional regulator with XRE-family HTH domain